MRRKGPKLAGKGVCKLCSLLADNGIYKKIEPMQAPVPQKTKESAE